MAIAAPSSRSGFASHSDRRRTGPAHEEPDWNVTDSSSSQRRPEGLARSRSPRRGSRAAQGQKSTDGLDAGAAMTTRRSGPNGGSLLISPGGGRRQGRILFSRLRDQFIGLRIEGLIWKPEPTIESVTSRRTAGSCCDAESNGSWSRKTQPTLGAGRPPREPSGLLPKHLHLDINSGTAAVCPASIGRPGRISCGPVYFLQASGQGLARRWLSGDGMGNGARLPDAR